MRIRTSFFILVFILADGMAWCQDSDFGLWYTVNLEKKLNKKIEVDGTFQVRTFSNASTIDQGFGEAGISYDLNKYLGFSGSYRLGNYLDKDHLYHLRHKWFADIKGSLPAGNFDFSLRLRFQFMLRTYIAGENDDLHEYDGRIKLKAMYKIPDFPVDPYLSFETFSPLFRDSGYLVEKSRTAAGLRWKISKKHLVEAEYIYERDKTPHLSVMNIVSIGYTFRF